MFRSLSFILASALIATIPHPAGAQAWPSKPVKIIVTFTTGGAADLTARILGEKLSDTWKQQVIIENRGGGNGSVGVEAVQRSPADGYTFLLLANTHVINVALYPKLSFDLFQDFAPALMTTTAPLMMAVHPRVKATNIAEITQDLRARPGKVDIATCGVATAHHFAMEIYKHATHTVAVHIPHRGCSPAVVDTVSGVVDVVMVSLPAGLPFVKQGKLRAIGITSKERSPSAPDIPTFRESGMKELAQFDVENYYGLLAPTGTPAEILRKLEADVRTALAAPEVKARLSGAGLDPYILGPVQMTAQMQADVEKFKVAIKVANIKPE
ncbi:MAG: tripartite tricarboxylate transporter substrate binding protein [Betaproteobacteria bacterium]|nr:tripartite tricarboxylate transporter substrate binding protein [Betaproteobacteria bacterium]